MKKRPPKFSVKKFLASRPKPIHISDKDGLKAQAAAITNDAIKKAQEHKMPPWRTGDPLGLQQVTSEQIETFLNFLERPRSERILRERSKLIAGNIIAHLQYKNYGPKE